MEKRRIVLPEIEQFYKGTLHKDIPEYQPIRIAHAIVTKGGNTLRMSGTRRSGPMASSAKAICASKRCRRSSMSSARLKQAARSGAISCT